MELWKRASRALKDQRSLVKASLTPRSTFRNPNIEKAVIKATTHEKCRVDYPSAQRIFAWVGVSNECLHLVLWALFRRIKRTCSWVVGLKGLMLLHGVFCCKVAGIQDIGKLPSDLLSFNDKHGKTSGLYAFIRAYYGFLDQKSSFIFLHSQEQRKQMNEEQKKEKLMIQDFIWLQKLQGLLHTLLLIQPESSQTVNVLVLEAMDCIVIEIYDIYSRISKGIGAVLVRIYSAGKADAIVALSILQKAKVQHQQLSLYLKICRDIGVGNASECPEMEQIPQKVIQELELITNEDSEKSEIKQSEEEVAKSIIVVKDHQLTKTHDYSNSISCAKTVITNDWEVFEEEKKSNNIHLFSDPAKNKGRFDPLLQRSLVELPDLISF